MTRYIAVVPLFHSKNGTYHQPDEEIDLSHLSPEKIKLLKDRGYIRDVGSAPASGAPEADVPAAPVARVRKGE